MKAPAPGGNPERAETSKAQEKSTAFLPEKPARPIFVLRLEPLPGIDDHRVLRELLKRARRIHRVRCVACREEAATTSGSKTSSSVTSKRKRCAKRPEAPGAETAPHQGRNGTAHPAA